MNPNMKTVSNNSSTIAMNEPNLTGFSIKNTKLIYYNSTDNIYELSMSDYIRLDRPRRINVVNDEIIALEDNEIEENNTYVFYDYGNKIWANIKCEKMSVLGTNSTTYWTWIPRYAYNINDKTVEAKFIDNSNKYYDLERGLVEIDNNYTVHPSFRQNNTELDGIWMSKYEPSKGSDESIISDKVLSPDVSGFDEETTYIMAYKSDGNEYKEIPLSTYNQLFDNSVTDNNAVRKVIIDNDNNVSNSVGNTDEENTYYIYDYKNKIWSTIKCVDNNIETWWTWIPRYAYYIDLIDNVNILFIDENDNLLDTSVYSVLPDIYTVHPAFNQNETHLKGIWMSKYEPSEKNN